MRFPQLLLTLLACLVLLLSACDGAVPTGSDSPSPVIEEGSPDSSPGAPSPEAPTDAGGDDGSEAPPSDEPDTSPVDPEEPPQPNAGQLTAGEWRDLDHWDFWLDLMNSEDWKQQQTRWGFSVTERVTVQLEAKTGGPIIDAGVTLKDKDDTVRWQARTDNSGSATLLPTLFDSGNAPYSLSVEAGAETLTLENVQVNTNEPLRATLNAAPTADALDLMLVIDTTGSMNDELEYLKTELQNVVERVKNANPNLDLRLSANYYRDEDDLYVVRSFPFTTDVSEVVTQISEQRSGGGGDYPEAVDLALQDAIEKHKWSKSARARLLFLVLDAPPHQEQDVLTRVQTLSRTAARKGIRIIPLGASGIDKDTEFLLRFLSIATDASYTFLTNDSGIGNEKIEPTVGDYQVDFLNDLMVKIINGYVE